MVEQVFPEAPALSNARNRYGVLRHPDSPAGYRMQ
jgi:hypothetical protein